MVIDLFFVFHWKRYECFITITYFNKQRKKWRVNKIEPNVSINNGKKKRQNNSINQSYKCFDLKYYLYVSHLIAVIVNIIKIPKSYFCHKREKYTTSIVLLLKSPKVTFTIREIKTKITKIYEPKPFFFVTV